VRWVLSHTDTCCLVLAGAFARLAALVCAENPHQKIQRHYPAEGLIELTQGGQAIGAMHAYDVYLADHKLAAYLPAKGGC
jgi:hypothetical protein